MQSDAEKEYNLNAKNVEDKRDAAMNRHNDVERICFWSKEFRDFILS